ncbi:Protein Brevis radix-like 4 [Acorus gramineus]|uniref:Protein Brevis radix-like 4 n=1 Tax=Acorus gramineus TaxID=55184 RepID=A0AAV9BXQ7_ACOGR|nr:Protein Brevis radix-like 4 [Acorus gramineus]
MALKASGAYKHCKPCGGSAGPNQRYAESESASERFHYSYRRAEAAGVESGSSTPRLVVMKGCGLWSGEGTPSMSGSSAAAELFMEEEEGEGEAREWVAQVEPGVLITFVSVARGGNDLKRIRFSREMFNKWQAQRWWTDNYDKVMELYNVQRFNRQAVPLPTTPRSEDESSKMESAEDSLVTPPLIKERLWTRNFQRPLGYSSPDSLEHHPTRHHHPSSRQHHLRRHHNHYYDSTGRTCGGLASTPNLSSLSEVALDKVDTSSMADEASARTSSSAERSGELSVSNASDQELVAEWVEQDEPGVYITIRALLGGVRELRRVRFSRERFGEMHARLWWEENRARIHEQYL